jgi:hypothetical protein
LAVRRRRAALFGISGWGESAGNSGSGDGSGGESFLLFVRRFFVTAIGAGRVPALFLLAAGAGRFAVVFFLAAGIFGLDEGGGGSASLAARLVRTMAASCEGCVSLQRETNCGDVN